MLSRSISLASSFRESLLPRSFGPDQRPNWVLRLVVFGVFAIAFAMSPGGVRQAFAQTNSPQGANPQHPRAAGSAASDVARGKYLVEDVAMCGQCHTPRNSSGNFDQTRWLQGAPIPWVPAKPDPNWPINAPRIGGNPPAPDADMIKLLTTGIWTNDERLRFPMPQFRMERRDAEAVVAYLKSLTPQP
jgi:mono/diheme cytochrome c family protein